MHDNYTHKDYTGYKLRFLLLTLPAAAFCVGALFYIESFFVSFLTILIGGAAIAILGGGYVLRRCPECKRSIKSCNSADEIQLCCDACQIIWHTKMKPSADE